MTNRMTGPTASFGFQDVDPSEKPKLVRQVFDQVASRYDLMNDLMSVGVHRLWKDATAARLNPQPGEMIIDCAGGTGDMALRYARMSRAAAKRRGGRPATVHVIDYNSEMITEGRRRLPDEDDLIWTVGDAQRLPLPDACANAYSISFGIRNVTDIAAALAEARRVLKPGGRFLCLEFSRPVSSGLRDLYDRYSFRVIPQIGKLVTGDAASYQYLVESIRRFPIQSEFAQLMEAQGFSNVSVTNFSGGIAALHHGWAI
jgi:demethylmenaquinone methyltransferase/2-methoxy-6-polyprenyl-1,4-benzoquinol methylase